MKLKDKEKKGFKLRILYYGEHGERTTDVFIQEEPVVF